MVDDAGAYRCRLGDAERHEVCSVLHRLRVEVVEMLEYAYLRLHVFARLYRCSPKPAQQVHAADEWLVAAEVECQVGSEVVVGLPCVLIEGVAILQ